MAKINLINIKGEKVKDLELNDSVWNITINNIVIKKAIDLALASLRQGTHKAKTRSEVSGGGRKPWRQKGTGRARQGTIRAPHWRGGGVVFAVTPRDYTFKMNKKEKSLALKSALSSKYQNNELVAIDNILLETLKTKDIVSVIKELKLDKKILFVTNEDNENLFLATRNLANVYTALTSEVSVLDLVYADVVVFDEAAINKLEEVLN